MVAGHGLVVGGAHYDTHLVGSLAVQGVVRIERPAPHRRPQEIPAQTQNQLEDTGIELMIAIIRPVSIPYPA